MTEIRYSAASIADFREIWQYIADDNESAADRVIREFDRKLAMLAKMPLMGKDESDLCDRLRSFPVGNYILFYRESRNGIELVRVIHGARDITEDYFGE